ncbi:hypothetical protein OAA60_02005 [Porticoccaceae bacterium]|jgi:hypothetical protein|nr:hypothetical protein [Porticoccaceae bacterium]
MTTITRTETDSHVNDKCCEKDANSAMSPIPPKQKRGRKPKIKSIEESTIEKNPKKRGRKPKGGKIIQTFENTSIHEIPEIRNVILHLKCSVDEMLNKYKTGQQYSNIGSNDIQATNISTNWSFSSSLNNNISDNMNNVNSINNNSNNNNTLNTSSTVSHTTAYFETRSEEALHNRLKILQVNLQTNNLMNTSTSACFWCTCPFNNPPIYIPKFKQETSYHVYGNFCGPECAAAYLMNEHIDSTIKFERYSLLNHIYGDIYSYCGNIKPAPSPYYMLDKYCGNLTIYQYRELLRKDKLLLVINHPLTRVLPELHCDNDTNYNSTKIKSSTNEINSAHVSSNSTNGFNGIFKGIPS